MHVSLHASEKHGLPARDADGDACDTRTELGAGPGRGWSENKGATAHTTSRGARQPACARTGAGGQDGQTVTGRDGAGSMEKEIVIKRFLKKKKTKPNKTKTQEPPTKPRVKKL